MFQNLNGFQVAQRRQDNAQIVRSDEFPDRLSCRWHVAGKANPWGWLDTFPAQRQPQNEVAIREICGDLTAQESDIGGVERLSLPADIARDIHLQERVDDRAKGGAVFPSGVADKRIAEVKHGLLAEAELADRCAVSGFAALTKRRDSALVLFAEDAIIRDEKTRPAQQRVRRVWPAKQYVEPESLGFRVVGVLQQFLEDRIPRIVPILQIALDLIDDRDRGDAKVRHWRSTLSAFGLRPD